MLALGEKDMTTAGPDCCYCLERQSSLTRRKWKQLHRVCKDAQLKTENAHQNNSPDVCWQVVYSKDNYGECGTRRRNSFSSMVVMNSTQ